MLRASGGWVDLAPPPHSWMSGFAARIEPAAGQHDPITARALVLDDGAVPLAIVACDLVGVSPSTAQEVHRRIAECTAIPATNVLLACTHTHSGPAALGLRGVMGHVDDAWFASARDRIVELAARVAAGLKPARIAHAAATVRGVGHNRQDPSRPFDETLRVVAVDGLDGAPIATLLNYATHAVVLGPANRQLSADYPGAACRAMERVRGGTALFLQGACGDVNPLLYLERGGNSGTFDDTEAIGRKLAQAGMDALAGAAWQSDAAVRARTSSIEIPLARAPALPEIEEEIARQEKTRQEMAASGNRRQELMAAAMLDWARDLLDAARKGRAPASIRAEIFAAGVGDARIVGAPFEVYSDIGLRVAEALRPSPVLFCGYANGLIGYCPSQWAIDQGGYGPATSHRWFPELLTPVARGADDRIVEEAARLARGPED